ncbi:hypothetical protein DPV78_005498 [Talaromyces pinophilus]|nr:hypothetical protein DPV78_005498 [Talaromyces pinophilus]
MTGHNGWAYGWEDRVIKVQGADIKIETQLTEWTDEVLAQRHALTLAHSVKTNQPLMLKITYDIGHGPQLLTFTKSKQNEWMPYPGGQIKYKVMTRVPGADVDKIRDNLSARERQSISYLVDLTHWVYQIVQDEITVYGPFVLESGLWTNGDLISPGLPRRERDLAGAKKCRIWSYLGVSFCLWS